MGKWQEALATMNAKDKTMFGLGKVNLKIKAALSGLDKLKPYAGTVYNGQRGLGGVDLTNPGAVTAWINANYPVGGVSSSRTSCRARSRSARRSSRSPTTPSRGDLEVKTGRDIQAVSLNSGEEEVLFAPGAKLVVDRDENKLDDPDPDQKKVWVHLMEV